MTEEKLESPPDVGPVSAEATQDDKLWGLLCWIPWVGWIFSIIALLIEPQKNRPFVKFNAVQSLAVDIILGVLSAVLSPTCVGSILIIVLWLATIYCCVKAYQGEWIEIPVLTDFLKGQNWI